MHCKLNVLLVCALLLMAACVPATAQYSIYCDQINTTSPWNAAGPFATSWSRVKQGSGTAGSGQLTYDNFADPGALSSDGKTLRIIHDGTVLEEMSGFLKSSVSLNGITGMNFDHQIVTCIFRMRTANDQLPKPWDTTAWSQTCGVAFYTDNRQVSLSIKPGAVALANGNGATVLGPTTMPMDNSSFHTWYLIADNTSVGTPIFCKVYRDGREVLEGTMPSTAQTNCQSTLRQTTPDDTKGVVFMGTCPKSVYGSWHFDRLAYHVGSFIPYGATDLSGAPVSGTVLDPWSVGTITGQVTDADTSQAIADAVVTVGVGTAVTAVHTDTNGTYTIGVPAFGDQTVTGSKFGYSDSTATVNVPDATPVTHNISLVTSPNVIQGVVTDSSTTDPIVGATVSVRKGTDPVMTATTIADGSYSIIAPLGTYSVTASALGYVPRNLPAVVVSAPPPAVTVNPSLIPLCAPTATITDNFPGPTLGAGWITTSPDTTTDVYNWYDATLFLENMPGHGISIADFAPVNIDVTARIGNLDGGYAGITYRQTRPCTYDGLYGGVPPYGYFARCAADGASVSLWRNGAVLATANPHITDWSFNYHDLRVIAYGSHHWVLLDGMKLIDTTSTGQLLGGYVGINRDGGGAALLSISASQLCDDLGAPIATLTGIVTDAATSAPMHAAVKLSNGKWVQTASDGTYTITLATLDDQNVTAYSPGYTTKVVAATSLHGGANTLNITLSSGTAAYSSINALSLANKGSAVSTTDKVATYPYDSFYGFFYIQDDGPGARGIRVRYPGFAVNAGDRVDVAGTLQQATDSGAQTNHNGEREISPDYVLVYPAHAPDAVPVYVRNSDVGGACFGPMENPTGTPEPKLKGVYPSSLFGDVAAYSSSFPASPLFNVGTLVTVCGKVTRACVGDTPSIASDYYIDDGSLPYDGWLWSAGGITDTNHPAGIRIRISNALYPQLPVYAVGDFLSVTGISGAISASDLYGGNGIRNLRFIRVSKPSDIQKL